MTTPSARAPAHLVLGAMVVVGGVVAGLVGASALSPGAAADPVLTPEEAAVMAQMSPDDRSRFLLQQEIQQKAQMTALLSQLQQIRHQTAVDVVDNIR